MLSLCKHETFKYIQERKKKSNIWNTISYQGIWKRSGENGGGILTAVLQICIMQMICMSNRKTNWQWQNNGVAGEWQALLEKQSELLPSSSMRRRHLQLFYLGKTLRAASNRLHGANLTSFRWKWVIDVRCHGLAACPECIPVSHLVTVGIASTISKHN